ncbi:MAG: Do family serine endopeptidase [Nitrospinota bacterium]|nr:Do family serine endopeptidase [Nitrospinota bacterium]
MVAANYRPVLLSTMSFRKFAVPINLLVLFWVSLVSFFPSVEASSNRRTPTVLAVEKAGPAVVNINTEETPNVPLNPFRNFRNPFFDQFFQEMLPLQNPKKRSLGSGVLIDPKGYIITNEHVVAKSTRIKVTLIDKREFDARLIGADIKSDLAIIKIDSKELLPYIEMGRSDDLMIGETVLAIGNPFGLQHTVTQGIISALHRSITAKNDIVYNDFIQVDASINPGNSGGPLLNIEGSLIGLNSAIYRKAEGIGFAIPINHAKRIVNDLIRFGKVHRGWLGVGVQDLTKDLMRYFHLDRPRGALVVKVFKESPAGQAGLVAGDIILAMDDKEILGKSAYLQTLSSYTVDDWLRLQVLRSGKKQNFKLRVSTIPRRLAEEFAMHWLGVRVQSISLELRRRYRLGTDQGVVVVATDVNGVSGRVGVRAGDVIRQVNQESIRNATDFNRIIVEAGQHSSVLLLIQRGRHGYYVTLEP